MSNSYDLGDLTRIRGAFTARELTTAERKAFALDGTLPTGITLDPTTVTLRIKHPDGSITTSVYGATGSPVVRDGVGAYHADVSLDTSGAWEYRWESTGNGQAAGRGLLYVATEW